MGLLSELFTEENLRKSDEYGFSHSLDAPRLRQAFDQIARQYCTIIEGNSQQQCDTILTGCGLNDDCRFGERCINAPDKALGFICRGKCNNTSLLHPDVMDAIGFIHKIFHP